MIRIRLARHGKKGDPFYRIVAIQKSKKRDGKPLAILGHWYPKKNEVKLDKKKFDEWVGSGAQVSNTVKKLINA